MNVKEIRAIRERLALKWAGMNAEQINDSCKGADEFQELVDEIREGNE